MKNLSKILLMATMLFAVSACSKEDGPADSDLFVGTYRGNISYQGAEQNSSDENGRVTVVKVGGSYTFDFGSGIPNITGVKFKETDDNTYISVGEGVTGITITASTLKMNVSNDGGMWTADCTR